MLFEPKHKNFKYRLKIEGSLKKFLNIKWLMSIPSPLKQYHFHAILIWWHRPFNIQIILHLCRPSDSPTQAFRPSELWPTKIELYSISKRKTATTHTWTTSLCWSKAQRKPVGICWGRSWLSKLLRSYTALCLAGAKRLWLKVWLQ
jgi:hypothetical protein